MMDGDTDYWVFTAPKTGKYKFSVAEINEGYHNTFYAYKGSKKVKSLYKQFMHSVCLHTKHPYLICHISKCHRQDP